MTITEHMAGAGRLWTRGFVIITLENFLVAINFWLMMTVVSKFATDRFGSSAALAGFASSIFIVGAVVGRPVCGKWVHRIGQTKTLYVGLALSLALSLASPSCSFPPWRRFRFQPCGGRNNRRKRRPKQAVR
jgi:MFS family permease